MIISNKSCPNRLEVVGCQYNFFQILHDSLVHEASFISDLCIGFSSLNHYYIPILRPHEKVQGFSSTITILSAPYSAGPKDVVYTLSFHVLW
jgi:hypothetical protein